jgi:hypothetical protein
MPNVNFKKLKERVPLTDVLEHYDLLSTLEESPQGYEGECPFCGSDAFKVNTQKNAWYCFGECKEKEEHNGGNILDFVARKECVSVKTAASRLASWFPEETADTAATDEGEAAGDAEGQGDSEPLPDIETQASDPESEPISSLTENKPLEFQLKGIDPNHHAVSESGIRSEDATEYGVGYFTGKGSMHNRIVFPFYDDDGRVLAYAGYSPKDGSWKYPPPEKFNPELTLYGYYHAREAMCLEPALIVCRDPLAVLRYRAKRPGSRPLAVTSPSLSVDQRALLERLAPVGGKVLLAAPADDPHVVEILSDLLPRYYIRLVRY